MNWKKRYKDRLVEAQEAMQCLRSGMRVYIHPGAAEPENLVNTMVSNSENISDVEVIHILTLGTADYVKKGMDGRFRHRSIFTGANVRVAVNEGRADHVPIFLSEIPDLFSTYELPVDLSLIHVSPPDEHGYCSLGVGIECTRAAVDNSKYVIAQVNRKMPRTMGNTFIHVNKIDYFVECDDDIIELPRVTKNEQSEKIGQNIASLISNGSTLQMGIGAIPDAVLHYLKDKRDLGLHTEMFSDGVMDLIESGVINNEAKTINRGKSVSSFVLGSKNLYEYIHDNPLFEFQPSEYVNDPFVISQNDKMVAINSAIQVDLTGQVCSDSIGYNIYSGIGGQVDFIRGASRSKGGIPIIALPSTARGDSVSRIVLHLDEGAGVVTSRGDVRWVVTEYGMVNLHGKSIRERAEALIKIAHPAFRDELRAGAKEKRLL